MYERPIPDYLQPDYIAIEDLALETGLGCETIRQTLQAARVPSRESDGHVWYAETTARAALVEHRGKSILDNPDDETGPEPEPVAEEMSIEAAAAAGEPFVDDDGNVWTHRFFVPPGA